MANASKSLTDAAATGSRRAVLVALRDKLAYTIENCESGRDVAALSRRLIDVVAELDTMPDEGGALNPLQAARAKYGGR